MLHRPSVRPGFRGFVAERGRRVARALASLVLTTPLCSASYPTYEFDESLPATAFFGEGPELPRWRLVEPGRVTTSFGKGWEGTPMNDGQLPRADTERIRNSYRSFPMDVVITQAMYVQTVPLTAREWREFFPLPEHYLPYKDCLSFSHESAGWHSALAYANALSARDGFEACYELKDCTGTPGVDFVCSFDVDVRTPCAGYRLPTAAEAAYACEGRGSATSGAEAGQMVSFPDWNVFVRFPDGVTVNTSALPNGFGLYKCHREVWTFDNPSGIAPGAVLTDPIFDDFFADLPGIYSPYQETREFLPQIGPSFSDVFSDAYATSAIRLVRNVALTPETPSELGSMLAPAIFGATDEEWDAGCE